MIREHGQAGCHHRSTTTGTQESDCSPSPLPSESPTSSYWTSTFEPPPSLGIVRPLHQIGEIPNKADVVIIGSGVTGVSAAYHLSRRFPSGSSVAILEARDFCSGATGRNGGHLTPLSALAYHDLASNPSHLLLGVEPQNEDTTRTKEMADEVIRKIYSLEERTSTLILDLIHKGVGENALEAQKYNDVGLTPGYNWHLCTSAQEEADFERCLRDAKLAGFGDLTSRVRRVGIEELKETLHCSPRIRAAFEIPGATVHPRKLVALIYRLALAQAKDRNIELRLFTHCPATGISAAGITDPNHRARINTPAGEITCRYILHATNGYASHLAGQLAGPEGVVPTRAQAMAIRPLHRYQNDSWIFVRPFTPESTTSLKDGAGCDSSLYLEGMPRWQMGMSANTGFEYLHQRPCGEYHDMESDLIRTPPVIFGGGREMAPGKEWNVADDSVVNPLISRFLLQWLAEKFPLDFEQEGKGENLGAEGQGQIVDAWTGIMGFTKSKDPLVGPLPVDVAIDGKGQDGTVVGQYVSAGYSGHGMTRAFSCAEVVCDMMVAEELGSKWEAPSWFPLCFLSTRR
ncbi:FAD dependent oxidoreductase [Violaceomyces palustris]|uniref:FAD dependent oxidoreductase n=1 Tax=Violaceomyces palustris TaxID=1673888 RepID=A0ACD0P7R6_9BASI|nr:FAD dependent oxidoreductase [Violaceomyces palustris]